MSMKGLDVAISDVLLEGWLTFETYLGKGGEGGGCGEPSVLFEKDVFAKTSAQLTRKHLYRVIYFSTSADAQPAYLSKKDSSTDVPLELLHHDQEHLFLRAPPSKQII